MVSLNQELIALIEAGNFPALEDLLEQLPIEQRMRIVSRLSGDQQLELLTGIDAEVAADILHTLPEVQSVEVIAQMPAESAAPILGNLSSDERADIVGDLDEQEAEAILREMSPQASAELRQLVQYSDEVAGGLMTSEFLAFRADESVDSVIAWLRQNAGTFSDFQVQYAYVVDSDNRLIGVLRLRDLLLGKPNATLDRIMIESPVSVSDTADMFQLRQFFDDHNYVGVPVTDDQGVLVGVVDATDVEEAWADRNADDYRKSQGIVQEELRSMPLMLRSRRRLAWLSINIVLNMVAASVIAMYQDTLSQVIALAVFLPVISDMSGCSGNQAVAVSMRELALGVIRSNEILFVLIKEISVGLINGLALGILIALVGAVWQGNPWLGLVIGLALMCNTIIAVAIGGTLPLIMRLFKLDPALASGPILTTITDMCGFVLVLGMATMLLDRLT